MLDPLPIEPCGPIDAVVRPPGSKSLTNRALVCAALAEGTSVLEGVLDSDDTRVMVDGLRAFGFRVKEDWDECRLRISGRGGRVPAGSAEIDAAASGTTMRFLTAMATLGHGQFRLDGTPRMRERPIRDLIDALGQLGAEVVDESGNGCPPVCVFGSGLPGGRAAVQGDISSQFLTGLLLAVPCAQGPVELVVEGELVSKPYITMTLGVMNCFGVTVEVQQMRRFILDGHQQYRAGSYRIEPDASAASYFAAAAITGGRVRIEGLSRNSLQGDVALCDCLERMGCQVDYESEAIVVRGGSLRGIDVDMNAISDTVQTLGVVALFADGPTTIRNVGHIRHKETDRLAALATELRKLGAQCEETPEGITVTPGELHGATIETYDDHRMAMSLALVGLRVPGVLIGDPGCTAKTYPGFFDDLACVTATGR